ncbi:hypothetical protein PHYSODRAFT_297519 [Phytophthora sojae]|uniref:Crinkler (CRN) family protein n=1 Tax=Phytophthora sojae (strain P6497) TaxID=1094619 RepID=G4YXC1_PHYSP|nr:hypothetical protein PHYSODRAFT_297519 [Phytophthora sojae]EGZ26155.1 hypothetical protein PHYSODRAFT_297519 [Phytophthora sojae]|eukprot:XP_009521443.1 hypothetical protein PHYSODRAFT_297519 [Phytophthora sojae]
MKQISYCVVGVPGGNNCIMAEKHWSASLLREKIVECFVEEEKRLILPETVALYLAWLNGEWLASHDSRVKQLLAGEIPADIATILSGDEIDLSATTGNILIEAPTARVIYVLLKLPHKVILRIANSRRRLLFGNDQQLDWQSSSWEIPVHACSPRDTHFWLEKEDLEESGLPNQRLKLYSRSAFHDQFKFLQEKVCDEAHIGWIMDPPGTGKSVTAMAFATTVDRSKWMVTWVHVREGSKLSWCSFMHVHGRWVSAAIQVDEGFENVLENLDADDPLLQPKSSCSKISIEQRVAMINAKFYYAGGSCSNMFQLNTQQIVFIYRVSSIHVSVAGLVGTHDNICASSIQRLKSSHGLNSDPVLSGWMLEMAFFLSLRDGSLVILGNSDDNTRRWGPCHIQMNDDIPCQIHEEPMCVVPCRRGKSSYNAILLYKRDRLVRFVQIVSGKKVGFNLEYCLTWLRKFSKSRGSFCVSRLEFVVVGVKSKLVSLQVDFDEELVVGFGKRLEIENVVARVKVLHGPRIADNRSRLSKRKRRIKKRQSTKSITADE